MYYTHCPKDNLNLCLKAEFVTVGADATAQASADTFVLCFVMFALMREYISTYFYTVMVKWRLILTWYYIDGDNFRLHIFLRQEKTD